MKHEDAREIIQSILDGEPCLVSAQVQETPEIDISAAVMARLPERHPASAPSQEYGTIWSLERLLAWAALCWIIGAVLMLMGLGIFLMCSDISIVSLPVIAYDFGKSAVGFVISAISDVSSVLRSIAPVIENVIDFVVRIRLLILISVAADTALLIIGVGLWSRRKAVEPYLTRTGGQRYEN